MHQASGGSWVKDLLDFVRSKSSIRPLIALFIISCIAVTAPRQWIEKIGVALWVSKLWPWLVLICLFSGLMLLIYAVEHLGGPIVKRHRIKRHIKRYFDSLSVDDIGVLQRYVESGKKTERFHPASGTVQNLVNAGILYWSGNLVSKLTGQDCTITPLAEPYLRGNKFQKHLDRLTSRQQKDRQDSIDNQKR